MAVKKDKKVVMALSGGVDSSVALWFLKKEGFFPIGLTLRLPVWKGRKSLMQENICCTTEGIRWLKKLCLKLEVPYYVLDCRKEFKKIVVDYFVKEYKKGKTPNPCIICNKYFRFPKFFEFAEKMKADFVATGHYARTQKNQKTGKFELCQAKDKDKDQSYFLALLSQKELSKLLFPLGDCTKGEVYRIAKKQGFRRPVERLESQDFCYVTGKSKSFFLEEELGQKPGLILNKEGKVLGEHRGLHFYTLGQRKGLKLSRGPFYVLKLDVQRNALIVTQNKKDLYKKEVILDSWSFILGEVPKKKIKVKAKTRYRQPLAKATLFPPKRESLKLIFDRPQFAITPGQYAVFYLPVEALAKTGQKGVCLGGGAITC
jgi:tRNA-specific 2-thiouridylase